MLTRVEARNTSGDVLLLPLQDNSSGYTVRDISGLGPVQATIVSSNISSMDGAKYQSSRRESRNILMRLGMSANYSTSTIPSLRARLYSFFSTKAWVSFRFIFTDQPTVDIAGYVETFENSMFTQDPEVSVSVMCLDPDYYETVSVVVNGSSVTDSTTMNVTYSGTIETGVIFTINIDQILNGFTVYFSSPDGILRSLEFDALLVAGDVVKINTKPGQKEAVLTRAGVNSSAIYAFASFSDWITLYPGVNKLRVLSIGTPLSYTIEYTNKYGAL